MAKGLQRSLSRAPRGKRDIVKEFIDMTGDTITVAGATGVGFGSVALGSFPEGFILLLGAQMVDLVLTGNGTGHVNDFDGDFGIGTIAASDGTLSGNDENIIVEAALGAATANVSPNLDAGNATTAIIDNSANDQDLYLNLLIDDADISADDVDFVVTTGGLWLVYTMIGDD